jgi:hypothetical protein
MRNLKKDKIIKLLIKSRVFKVDVKAGTVTRRGKNIGYIDSQGYERYSFRYKEKFYNVMIHNIIWIAANGLLPKDKEINHIDGNKLNNKISNLELLTPAENIRHAFKNQLNKGPLGEKNGNSKLTDNLVAEFRKRYKQGERLKSLQKEVDISLTCLADAVFGKSYKHIKELPPLTRHSGLYPDEVKNSFIELFNQNLSPSQIAIQLGISRATAYIWVKETKNRDLLND